MRGVDIACTLLIPLASAVRLWYGGGQVLADSQKVRAGLLDPNAAFTTGDLVMFLAYLTALLGPIATLAESATGLQDQLAGVDRRLEVMAEPVEMPASADPVQVSKATVEGRITFGDVSFSYPTSRKKKGGELLAAGEGPKRVLEDISLDVKAGETIALVGPSGAGKTTLCNLVARFYDATSGVIELDGVD